MPVLIFMTISYAGVTWLLSKGADTNMLERIKSGDVGTLERHINEFAKVTKYLNSDWLAK